MSDEILNDGIQNELQEEEISNKKQKRFKSYNSLVYLNHRIGNDIKFSNGSYTAKSKAQEKQVESDQNFGKSIFISESE